MDHTRQNEGGRLLRILRKQRGLSLQQAADALTTLWGSGDVGHLSRIERGVITQPMYETLDAYLTILHATYTERCAILDTFGYRAGHPLPTIHELDAAQRACSNLLETWPAPAYILDPWHRFVHWNRLFPCVLDRPPDSLSMLRLRRCSIIEAVFDPIHRIWDSIANRDDFIPQMIRLIQREGEPYRQEQWYQNHLNEALITLPHFYEAWVKHAIENSPTIQRTAIPLRLKTKDQILSFRFLTDTWDQDIRLRIVHYIAADVLTQHVVNSWISEIP